MSAPMCRVHNVELKPSQKGGGFYCPKKLPDGSWCNEKGDAPAPAAPQSAALASGGSPQVALILGALSAAATVYQGTGNAEDFVTLANQIYEGWREVV